MLDFRDLDIYYSIKNEADNAWAKYKYVRGYLISDKEYTVKQDWKKVSIRDGQWYATYDPLNEVSYQENAHGWVFILGTAMDTDDWHMNLSKIARKCLQKATVRLEDFYDYIDCLNGRHIIILNIDGKTILLQDATGMRSVYFHRSKFCIASHYNLVNDYAKSDRHPFMAEFIAMKKNNPYANPWMLPGNITPYKDIVSLQPNHALDFQLWKVYRFWPRKNHEEISFDEAMDYIADNIKRQMQVLCTERKVMMQMTKGNDSRISLAAAKDVREGILFYNYYSKFDNATVVDYEYAQKSARELELNFKEINVTNPGVSKADYEKIKSVAYYNSYHLHQFNAIGNYMECLPNDRIVVRSNIIEIIRSADSYYRNFPIHGLTYMDMLKAAYPSKINDITVQYIWKKFYEENQWDKLYNFLPWDVFYWEYRMGTWMSQGVVIKDDWNFDTYMLFNCRKLLEYGLSAPFYFTKGGFVPAALIKRLWPQLFFEIPNTDFNLLEDYYFEANSNVCDLSSFEFSSISDDIKVKKYAHLGRTQGVIGFSSEAVKKGDTISLERKIKVQRDGNYHFQINFLVPKQELQEPYCSICRIEIGEVSVYFDLNICWSMENQVNIILPCKKGECGLAIKLISVKDAHVKRGCPGVVSIKSIYFQPTNKQIKSNAGFDIYSTVGLN